MLSSSFCNAENSAYNARSLLVSFGINILVKRGFVIKHYSLRGAGGERTMLLQLKEELENLEKIEKQSTYDYAVIKKELGELEKAYIVYTKEKLPLTELFTQYMNNAFSLAKVARVRADELIGLLGEGKKLHPEDAGTNANRILKSLEKMMTQIAQFVSLFSQIVKKLVQFEAETYYPSPRMYGRIMGSKEFKKMKETQCLSADKDPTPVFDCSEDVKKRILTMRPDQREGFFRWIGVRNPEIVVFFQTRLKPIVGPIPQANGLQEYKFPSRIPVEILQAA